jgi:hypothetical protein
MLPAQMDANLQEIAIMLKPLRLEIDIKYGLTLFDKRPK